MLDGVRAGPGERGDLACMVPERDIGILSVVAVEVKLKTAPARIAHSGVRDRLMAFSFRIKTFQPHTPNN